MSGYSFISPTSINYVDFNSITNFTIFDNKVIYFENCPAQHSTISEITRNEFFKNFLNNCKNLSVFIFNCEASIDNLKPDDLIAINENFSIHYSAIFSFESSSDSNSILLYKNNTTDGFRGLEINPKHFNKIYLTSKRDIEGNEKQILVRNSYNRDQRVKDLSTNFNLEVVIEGLLARHFGKFKGKFLKIGLADLKCFNKLRIVDYAVAKSDCLVIQFLHLFDTKLNEVNENYERPLEVAVKKRNCSLKAFKELIKYKENSPFRIMDHKDLMHHHMRSSYNLLMMAAENRKDDFVEFLLKFNYFDVNYSVNSNTAASLAIRNENYSTLLILLKHDAKYPSCSIPRNEILNELLDDIERLHTSVKTRDKEGVIKVINKYPTMKYFYNDLNESAAAAALKYSGTDMYNFLVSNGISLTREESLKKTIEDSIIKEKNFKSKIEQIHRSNSKTVYESYFTTLLEKSHVAHNVSEQQKFNHFKYIVDAYGQVAELPTIQLILKIIAGIKSAKIIFEFNRDTVDSIDPQSNEFTLGISYYLERYAYIGCRGLLRRDKSKKILALCTISHELGHIAFQEVFENDGKPYKKSDLKTQREYVEIVKNYHDKYESKELTDEMIRTVFKYKELYWESELIVQVLANYTKNMNERSIDEHHKTLNDFFKIRVLPELNLTMKEQSFRNRLEELNRISGLIDDLRSFPIELDENFFAENFNGNQIILSNCPQLTLQSFHKKVIRSSEKPFCFLNSNFINIPDRLKAVNELLEYKISMTFVIYSEKFISDDDLEKIEDNLMEKCNFKCKTDGKFEEVDAEVGKNLLVEEVKALYNISPTFDELPGPSRNDYSHNLETQKEHDYKKLIKQIQESNKEKSKMNYDNQNTISVILIAKNHNSNQSLFNTVYFEVKVVNHSWSELTSKSKDHLKSITVNFQGTLITLGELISETSVVLKHLPISVLLRKNKTLQIGPLVAPKLNTTRFARQPSLESDADEATFYTERTFLTEIGVEVNLKEIEAQVEREKMILLVDKAGAGKTTTFRNVAKEIKSRNPKFWVSFIDLKRYIDSYGQVNLKCDQSVVTFIAKAMLELNEVDEEIFLELFQLNRVILLFDGFDEICPHYNELMMRIFEVIQSLSLNQIWISTRPLDAVNLGQKLNCTIFKFNPFTEDSRRDFIKKFFARQRVDKSQIDEVYCDVISFIDKIETFKENVLDNSLMLQMITEIRLEKRLNFDSNLYQIFKEFETRKQRIVDEKGEVVGDDRKKIEKSKVNYRGLHQYHGLRTIVGDKFFDVTSLSFLHLDEVFKINDKLKTDEKINRYGIMTLESGHLNFIHRTFAEYFVTKFLLDNIWSDECLATDSARNILKLLFYFLYYEHSSVIYTFLTNCIDNKSNRRDKNEINSTVKQLMLTEFSTVFDSFNSFRVHSSFISRLTYVFKHDRDILNSLWSVNCSETFFIRFARKFSDNIARVNTIHKIAKMFFPEDDNVIRGFNQTGNILFIGWMCRSERKFIYKLVEITGVSISDETIEEILETRSITEFLKIISVNKDEMKEMFLRNSLDILMSVETVDEFEILWRILIDTMNEQEVNSIVKTLNRKGNSIFHELSEMEDVEVVQKFLNLIKFSNYHDFKALLMRKNAEDNANFIILLARNSNEKCVKLLLDFVRKTVSDIDQRDLLLETYTSDNKLVLTALHQSMFNSNEKVFIEFKNYYKSFMTDDEIKDKILKIPEINTEIFFKIIPSASVSTITCVFNYLSEIYDKESLKELLVTRDERLCTIFTRFKKHILFKSHLRPFEEFLEGILSAEEQKELYLIKI